MDALAMVQPPLFSSVPFFSAAFKFSIAWLCKSESRSLFSTAADWAMLANASIAVWRPMKRILASSIRRRRWGLSDGSIKREVGLSQLICSTCCAAYLRSPVACSNMGRTLAAEAVAMTQQDSSICT